MSPRSAARIAVFALLIGCASSEAAAPSVSAPYRILFVGNSLTYFNDLPGLVEALADSAGADTLGAAAVAFPDYSLEDHWNDRRAVREIARGGWDVVVLQQGPSALDESRVLLLDYVARFDSVTREAGGRPALYMVWPSVARFGDFDRVSESYRLAAEHVQGLLLPCGEAWRAAWQRDSTLPLYGPDGFHPSPLGTYLAALVIVQRLTGHSPVGLPARVRTPRGVVFGVEPALARVLQDAALEANQRF